MLLERNTCSALLKKDADFDINCEGQHHDGGDSRLHRNVDTYLTIPTTCHIPDDTNIKSEIFSASHEGTWNGGFFFYGYASLNDGNTF